MLLPVVLLLVGVPSALALGYVLGRRSGSPPSTEPSPALPLTEPDSKATPSLRHLEQVVETMQLGVTVTDLEGRIVYVNPADTANHGYQKEQLLNADVRVYASASRAKPMSLDKIAKMKRWQRESVNLRRGGSSFPVHLMSDMLRDRTGTPIGVVTTCEDITERRRAEEALQASEERYALAMRGADDGLWDWNLEAGEIFYSARWKSMLGYGEHQIGNSPDHWLSRVHPEDLPRLKTELRAHRDGETSRFQCEHRVLDGSGKYRWVEARGIAERSPEGHPYRIAGALTDITERKTVEERLAKEALYDSLTGLPNRAFLADLLERAFQQLKRREGYRFGLLFLDLDGFKEVNDALGHAAGDELLAEVARRLREAIRPGDVAARVAGDEFCVLLDDLRDSADTTRVAERVRELLARPVDIEGHSVRTSASIGIAVSDDEVSSPDELIHFADTAMYRAKARGAGLFEVYDRSMHARAVALFQMEGDLKSALQKGQLRLVYQPVVALDTGRVRGLEALVRWDHPVRGELKPEAFVPLADTTGLIVPLGWWVLEEASKRMAGWIRSFPGAADTTVSVNLSGRQLMEPDLVPRISQIIQAAELDPGNLQLEISEAALMERADANAVTIGTLRELGVRVQIDDFGTGTSSLAYLKRFHVSTLKIDGSFIRQMDGAAEQPALIQAVITLARDLEIDVVAEGIETAEQSKRLQSLQCGQGQGYHYSRPLAPNAVAEILAKEGRERRTR